MVTIDESIRRQLNTMTGNRSSLAAEDIMVNRQSPESLNLIRQFAEHTQYQLKRGQLCSEDRRLNVNAMFLNNYLAPGIERVQVPETRQYIGTLNNILGCVDDRTGNELGLYLFIDTARLLPNKMEEAEIQLINDFTRKKGTSTLIATWGFLADKVKFGTSLKDAIGTNGKYGPLANQAKNRALEIYGETK